MKKIFSILALSACMTALAHETDNYHWARIFSDNNGNTTYINADGFYKRKKEGAWLKTEENNGSIEIYRRFITNCKGVNPVYNTESRVASKFHNFDHSNKNIQEVINKEDSDLIRKILCTDIK